MYANYNAPAYNTKLVKREELPKTYEEFLTKKQWANRVAIDGTDNEWLKAMFEHYGEQRATEIIKGIVSTLKPIITDGHLALARATGAGEYAITLNNYVNLSMNVKLAGGPIDVWAMDPVALMFGQVGVSALAPNPNAAQARRELHAQPGGAAVHRQIRPAADAQRRRRQSARHRRDAQAEEGHSGAADAGGGKGLAAPVPGTVQAAVIESPARPEDVKRRRDGSRSHMVERRFGSLRRRRQRQRARARRCRADPPAQPGADRLRA